MDSITVRVSDLYNVIRDFQKDSYDYVTLTLFEADSAGDTDESQIPEQLLLSAVYKSDINFACEEYIDAVQVSEDGGGQ